MPADFPPRLDLVRDDAPLRTTTTSRTRQDRKKTREKDRELIEVALDRFKLVSEAESKQRDREKEDLQFARGWQEDHWPEAIRRLRQGGIGPDGRTIAERPCLTIDKIGHPVQGVINEARQARLAIQIKAKGDGADQEGAELRQGMIRAIEVDSGAQNVRLWALDRAVKCGRGYYRILTTYANDGDFDLDIRIARIKHQGSVYLDPNAQEADYSDGEFAFLVEDMTASEFKRRYGKDKLPDSGDAFSSTTDLAPGWITDEHIRVAEYWWVEHETRTLLAHPTLPSEKPLFLDELPEGVTVPDDVQRREVDVRKVKWALITATDVLDERDWPGRYIPIIPVLGVEQDVDGQEICYQGMVSKSKDSQRSYNYMRSAQVEAVGLAPRAPWIMAEGQDTGFETMWDQANVKNFTRLIYKPTTFGGEVVPPPQRNVAEPAIQAISLAVQQAEADIRATTGRYEASLGAVGPERSGKAINALRQQGEIGSSNYLENLANISMTLEGRILLDLLPKVYDRPGRIVRLLGDDIEGERQVMLHQPFLPTPQGPMPLPPGAMPPPGVAGPMGPGGPPMPPGMPPGPPPGMPPGVQGAPMNGGMPPGMPPGMMPGMPPPPAPKFYDLSKGDYACVVAVGQSFATQRESNMQLLQSLIESTGGQIAPMVIDLLAEQLDGPMGRKMAERFRKLNPALGEGDGGLPPAAQQQIQQLQQQLQQAQQLIETEQVKIQAQAQVEMQKLQAQAQLKQLEQQASIQVEQQRLQIEAAKEQAKAQAEIERAQVEAQFKLQLQKDQQAHERALKELELSIETASREKIALLQVQGQMQKAEIHAEAQDVMSQRQAAVQIGQRAMTTQAAREDRALTLAQQREQAARDAQEAARDRAHEAMEAERDRAATPPSSPSDE